MKKKSRYSAPEFDKACQYFGYNYLATNFMKTKIYINNLSKEELEELDNYAKWNLLTKDTDGNYHINYYTYYLLFYILNGYKCCSYDGYNIYEVVRFFWHDNDLRSNINELCIKQFEKNETNPDKLKRLVYFAQEYSRILEGKHNITFGTIKFFEEYNHEVDLFKKLLESRENNLTLERKI